MVYIIKQNQIYLKDNLGKEMHFLKDDFIFLREKSCPTPPGSMWKKYLSPLDKSRMNCD